MRVYPGHRSGWRKELTLGGVEAFASSLYCSRSLSSSGFNLAARSFFPVGPRIQEGRVKVDHYYPAVFREAFEHGVGDVRVCRLRPGRSNATPLSARRDIEHVVITFSETCEMSMNNPRRSFLDHSLPNRQAVVFYFPAVRVGPIVRYVGVRSYSGSRAGRNCAARRASSRSRNRPRCPSGRRSF